MIKNTENILSNKNYYQNIFKKSFDKNIFDKKHNSIYMQVGSYSPPICFNKGTKILCLNKNFEEEYIPIENLNKNDLVKSYKNGYRKID